MGAAVERVLVSASHKRVGVSVGLLVTALMGAGCAAEGARTSPTGVGAGRAVVEPPTGKGAVAASAYCPELLAERVDRSGEWGRVPERDRTALGIAAERAWLCRYVAVEDEAAAQGAPALWERHQPHRVVPPARVPGLLSALRMLDDADEVDAECEVEASVRWLLALEATEDSLAVVVDGDACGVAWLTEDPFVVAPGGSQAPGVATVPLSAGSGLVRALRDQWHAAR